MKITSLEIKMKEIKELLEMFNSTPSSLFDELLKRVMESDNDEYEEVDD